MGKPWFNPKVYGYGAGLPCSWEGWAVLVVFLAIMIGLTKLPTDTMRAWVGSAAVVGLIVIVVAKTRGGWRWRWGQHD